MVERVEAVAAEEGLLFRLGEAQRANTVDAHRLLHLALETGRPGAAVRAQGGAARGVLPAGRERRRPRPAPSYGGEGGPRPGEASTRCWAADEYADAVEADIREAAALGANGVPFFVIDRKYGVSGAQPAEAFAQVLERAWSESHPQLEHVGHGDGDVCGPDGCPV